MLKDIKLITERKNPSYVSWIKAKLKKNLVSSPELDTFKLEEENSKEGEEEDDNYDTFEADEEEDEQEEMKKAKDTKFLKNYFKQFDPNL